MRRIMDLLKVAGIEIIYMHIKKNGYYDPILKILFINVNLSDMETKKKPSCMKPDMAFCMMSCILFIK
jgi:hypothetical protein